MPGWKTIGTQAVITIATMFVVNQVAAMQPAVRNVIGGANKGFLSQVFGSLFG